MDFGKNSLMALIGVEAKRNHFEDMFGEGKGLEIEDPNYLYLGNVTANKNTGSGASNYSMFSVFGKSITHGTINISYHSLCAAMPLHAFPTATTMTGSHLSLPAGAYLRKNSWRAPATGSAT